MRLPIAVMITAVMLSHPLSGTYFVNSVDAGNTDYTADDGNGIYGTGYIPSELDNNVPVYEPEYEVYSQLPQKFPDSLDNIQSNYPNTRNQNPYGTCWAFSSIGLAEFDLINDGAFDKNIDLSELQLIHFAFNSVQDPLGGTTGDYAKYYNEYAQNTYLNYGGNYEMASRRFSQWVGVANESDVPYSNAAVAAESGVDSAYAYDADVAHLKNAYIINIKQDPDAVKQMIMEHGAVGVSYYHSDNGIGWSHFSTDISYYDTEISGYGHAVMVVGWDDEFSFDGFYGTQKPTSNGAWLVRNSWGNYCNYFWMSYETASLAEAAWVFDFDANNEYDNNYQLDGGIATYQISYTTMANIFKVKKDDKVSSETLKAVSLSFTMATNVNYTVEIYTDLTDSRNPLSGIRQDSATTRGTTAYAGIYTVELADTVKLTPGSTFSVVVTVDKAAIDCEEAWTITDSSFENVIWDCAVSQYDQKTYYMINGRFYPYMRNIRVKAFTCDNTDNGDNTPEKPNNPDTLRRNAVTAFVKGFYKNILERDAASSEVEGWTDSLLNGGCTVVQVTDGFIFGEEYESKQTDDEAYVKMLYRSILEREPQSDEVEGMITVLNYGVSRKYVYSLFVSSDEFTAKCSSMGLTSGSVVLDENRDKNVGVTKFVVRCYEKVLQRTYDVDGLNGWCSVLLSESLSPAEVAAAGFINSDEFESKNVSDEEFVTILYRTFMDREPEPEGLAYWSGELSDGMSRDYIIHGFTESQEFADICSVYGMNKGSYNLTAYYDQNPGVTKFVVRLYRKALGREPEDSGLNGWCECILSGNMAPVDVAKNEFFGSKEFTDKNLNDEEYVKTLYRTFMGREAEETGLSGWLNCLQVQGWSRDEVLMQFADSQEFKDIMAQYGL